MTQKNVSLTDNAYMQLAELKGTLSFSKLVIQLISEHKELTKLKADMERCKPE